MKKQFWSHAVHPICLMALTLCAGAAWSQQTAKPPSDPIVTLNPQQAASFGVAFLTLAHETGMAFIAEDGPLHQTLPARFVPVVAPDGEPLSRVASRVAAAYDYDVQRKGDVFVLRKRFSDPADLPDVTLAECAQDLADEQQALDALSPHLNWTQLEQNEVVHDLLASLTPDQLQAMHDKTEEASLALKSAKTPDAIFEANQRINEANVQTQGLPVSALTPYQREAIRQIVLVVHVQLPSALLDIAPVQEAAQKDPRFCWRKTEDYLPMFGYEIPAGPKTVAFSQLTFPEHASRGANGSLTFGPGANGNLLTLDDPTAPLAEPPPSAKPLAGLPSAAEPMTLAQTIADLKERTRAKVLVNAALASKHVSVFGGTTLPASTLVHAMADVYGLRVKVKDDGTLLLTLLPHQIPLNYAALVVDVQNALPDPLARAALQDSARENVGGDSMQSRSYWRGASKTEAASLDLRDSALRALRTEAEPCIRAAKDGRVPLSSLSSRANTALAVVLATPSVQKLAALAAQGVPEVISRFDELRLVGGPFHRSGETTFELELDLPGTDDTQPLQRGIHIGNLNDTPPDGGG